MLTTYSQISLNNLALWILKITYGKTNPSFSEIEIVKKELHLIYLFEIQSAQQMQEDLLLVTC
ncbi:MAG: hypothetical protein JSR33_09980 [Proteobacteria bacterium]|nr:hypothetical protein [Pseudomonadota bacterium]